MRRLVGAFEIGSLFNFHDFRSRVGIGSGSGLTSFFVGECNIGSRLSVNVGARQWIRETRKRDLYNAEQKNVGLAGHGGLVLSKTTTIFCSRLYYK